MTACLQAVCTRATGTATSETAYKFHKGRAKAKFRGKYKDAYWAITWKHFE